MLPEIETYDQAVEAAVRTKNNLHEAIKRTYDRDDDRNAYYDRRSTVNNSFELSISLAWEELKVSVTDPLAKLLISDYGDEYKSQVLVLIRTFPCTVEEMNRLRDNENWCGVYDEFYGKARLLGLLPGMSGLSPTRQKLVSWFLDDDDIGNDTENTNKLLEFVDAIVAEHVATLEKVELEPMVANDGSDEINEVNEINLFEV